MWYQKEFFVLFNQFNKKKPTRFVLYSLFISLLITLFNFISSERKLAYHLNFVQAFYMTLPLGVEVGKAILLFCVDMHNWTVRFSFIIAVTICSVYRRVKLLLWILQVKVTTIPGSLSTQNSNMAFPTTVPNGSIRKITIKYQIRWKRTGD